MGKYWTRFEDIDAEGGHVAHVNSPDRTYADFITARSSGGDDED